MKSIKIQVVGLLVLGWLVWPCAAQDGQQNPWIKNPANGHFYRLLPNATWLTSARWANELNGYLVTIENEQEQQWVFNTFGKGGEQRLLWIGLTTRGKGQVGWVDDSPLNYTNWAPGEPNKVGDTEQFVAMYYADFNAPGAWNDWDDRTTDPVGIPFQGVIEYEP